MNRARTGLWGGRVGNHRLYPAGDALQPTLVPRSGFQARLTPSVRWLTITGHTSDAHS